MYFRYRLPVLCTVPHLALPSQVTYVDWSTVMGWCIPLLQTKGLILLQKVFSSRHMTLISTGPTSYYTVPNLLACYSRGRVFQKYCTRIPRSRIAGLHGNSIFNFLRHSLPLKLYQITFPSTVHKPFLFSTSSPTLTIASFWSQSY